MATTAFATGAYAATQNLMKTAATGLGGGGSALSTLGKPEGAGSQFASLLGNAVNAVSQSGKTAETQAMAAMGGKADLVDVVTAVAESETAMETLVAVRDRVIAAYEEIMRMPI